MAGGLAERGVLVEADKKGRAALAAAAAVAITLFLHDSGVYVQCIQAPITPKADQAAIMNSESAVLCAHVLY